jgi:3-oxoacyl-[acyl-carrier-protein] synthase II
MNAEVIPFIVHRPSFIASEEFVMRRRVVVTGIGCVTPVGNDVETMWKALLRGDTGIGRTTIFDASNFPTKISAEVKGFDLASVGEDPEKWKYQARHTRFAVGAAKQAVRDSGLEDSRIDPTRFGVYLGSGEGPQDFDRFTKMMLAAMPAGEGFDVAKFTQVGLEVLHPIAELSRAEHAAGHMAAALHAGPNVNASPGAASSQAVGEAKFRRGDAVMLPAVRTA